MDKGMFKSYKFKPSDVIEGLNRYFAETKANRYLRVPLEIKNGEVKPGNYYVIRNIVFDAKTPKIKECGYYYVICYPEEVVGVAINWLREEHNIFYTPGMSEPPIKDPDDIFCMKNLKETKNFSVTIDDFYVDDAAREYEKETRKDLVPVEKVREALGIAEDSDIFEAIAVLKKSDERAHSEMYKARGEKYELLKQVREILNLNPEVNLFDALRCARGDMDAATRLRLESSELSHRNRELCKRLVDIRKATGMADDDPTDLVKYVDRLREKTAEQQKKIDSYESTLSKITDIMEPKYAGPAWSETWDDLVERIKRMKEKVETLDAEKTDWKNSFNKAQDSRSAFCKKLKEELNVDYRYPGCFPKMEEDILLEIKRLKTEHDDVRGLSLKIEELEEQLREANEELANHRVAEGWLRKDNSDLAIDVANLKEQLRVLRDDILKVYREIFDCSNGDPEGTDEETLQDILTEYKRTLELKNVAEEKTIKYKELARENEDTAKENKVQWNNTKEQLQWAQKENLEWLKRYEQLKSELNEMKRLYCGAAVGNGSLCEELAKEREWTKRLEQKLIEIQDICER